MGNRVRGAVLGLGLTALTFTAGYTGLASRAAEPTEPPAATTTAPVTAPATAPAAPAATQGPTIKQISFAEYQALHPDDTVVLFYLENHELSAEIKQIFEYSVRKANVPTTFYEVKVDLFGPLPVSEEGMELKKLQINVPGAAMIKNGSLYNSWRCIPLTIDTKMEENLEKKVTAWLVTNLKPGSDDPMKWTYTGSSCGLYPVK